MFSKLFSKKEAEKNPTAGPTMLGNTVDTTINITSIAIPKYRVRGDYIEYVVECSRNATTWHVYRRYQQFKTLDQQLKQLCSMGSPNHCEYGVIPVLTGSHWTNVTNQSQELVERRRRYLEIYLQQLTVPKNLFYAAKTVLHSFLHDGEVLVTHRSRNARGLPGYGELESEDIISLDADDAQFLDSSPAFDNALANEFSENEKDHAAPPRQIIAVGTEKLSVCAEKLLSEAIPDLSLESAGRAQFTAQHSNNNNSGKGSTNELGEARPMSPEPVPKMFERCKQCNAEKELTCADVEHWVNFGKCSSCKKVAEFELMTTATAADAATSDDGTQGALPEIHVDPSSPMASRTTATDGSSNLSADESIEILSDESDSDGEFEDQARLRSRAETIAVVCAQCGRSQRTGTLTVTSYQKCFWCKDRFCAACLGVKKVQLRGDDDSHHHGAPSTTATGGGEASSLPNAKQLPTTGGVATSSPGLSSAKKCIGRRICKRCAMNQERHLDAHEGPLYQRSSSSQLAPSQDRDAHHNNSAAALPPSPMKHAFREDCRLVEFQLVTTLGRGTFGKVIKVFHKPSKRVFAMKVLSKVTIQKRRMIEYIKEEKAIMAKLPPHPYIVTMHFAFQNDQNLFMILDFLPGGELYTHIYPNRRMTEDTARFYIAEVVLALEHIHNYDIVHRDLKPENIVLDSDGHLKLTDFGLARQNFSKTRRKSFVGSAEYLAPETINGEVQTKALDWWSLGVMLFEMLSGAAPFHAANNNDVYEAVLHKKLDLDKPYFSATARHLINALLEKDPRARLSDPAKIKAHPFFEKISWAKLMNRELPAPFRPNLDGNDTKYFNRDFTAEWATIPRAVGNAGRQTLELLTRRFSNFKKMEEGSSSSSAIAVASSPGQATTALAGSYDATNNNNSRRESDQAATPEMISASDFIGVWRLLRVELRSADGKVSYPWGSEVCGLLVYCDNGLYSLQLAPMRRHKFRSTAPDKVTQHEMCDAYISYLASFGTYRLKTGADYMLLLPQSALCPNLSQGVKERRYFSFDASRLNLTLITSPHSTDDGIEARTAIVWEKI